MAFRGSKYLSDLDYKTLKEKFEKLKFVGGVAMYFDPNQKQIEIDLPNNKKIVIDNKYSIVTSDGSFLSDKNPMYLDRFYHKITINKYGLFEVTSKSYSFDSVFYHTKLFDTNGNYLRQDSFETLIKILSNRNKCYHPDDFSTINKHLVQDKIYIGSFNSGWWLQNQYDLKINYNSTLDDGLILFSKDNRRPGSDSENELYYIKDSKGNSLYLGDFYTGMKMLHFGKLYLEALLTHSLEYQLNLQELNLNSSNTLA